MASPSNRDNGSRKSKLFIGISTVVFVAGLAATAWSVEGIRSVVFLTGGTLTKTPDATSGPVDLGFSANFFGPAPYNQVFVNENGNVTFTAPNPSADPSTFDGPMIAPFFTDIDTTPESSGEVEFGQAIVDGKEAFVVNWPNVSFNGSSGNASFQLVLTNEPDGSTGIEFNYGSITGPTTGSPTIGLFPGEPEENEEPDEPIIIADKDNPLPPQPDPEECTDESTDLVCKSPEFIVEPGKKPVPDPNPEPENPGDDPVICACVESPPLPPIDDPFIDPEAENPPQIIVSDETTDAPEPASLLLLGVGLASLGALRRRRRTA